MICSETWPAISYRRSYVLNGVFKLDLLNARKVVYIWLLSPSAFEC